MNVPAGALDQLYIDTYPSSFKENEERFRLKETIVSSFSELLVRDQTSCTVFQRSSTLGAAPLDAASVFFPILHEDGMWSLIVILPSYRCILHFLWARVDRVLARQLESVSSPLLSQG